MNTCRPRDSVSWLLLSTLVLLSCQTEVRPPPRQYRAWVEALDGHQWSEPEAFRGADKAAGPKALQQTYEAQVLDSTATAHDSPFHRVEWNTIHNPSGTVTKLYYFRVGQPGARVYLDLLKQFVPGFSGLQEGQDYWLEEKYTSDPRKKNDEVWRATGDFGLPFGSGDVADLLMLTAPDELLERVDQFLDGVLQQTPQIEVEVTIVELAVDDDLRSGIQLNLLRGTADEPENNLFQSIVVNLAQDLVKGTFGSFSAIQDESVINGLIEFLQTNTESSVLSAPKLAVLNGHRAVIDAGSEIPVFTPKFNNVDTLRDISTQFKNTGTKVVIVPFLISQDMVQLEISIEASTVTGFVTAGVGSSSAVENPLISRRNAHTVVNVPSGKTVLIGGLSTSDDVESESRIPILGDIPLVGRLFQRRSSQSRRSQVMFMVKPSVVRQKDSSRVLFDPTSDLE